MNQQKNKGRPLFASHFHPEVNVYRCVLLFYLDLLLILCMLTLDISLCTDHNHNLWSYLWICKIMSYQPFLSKTLIRCPDTEN